MNVVWENEIMEDEVKFEIHALHKGNSKLGWPFS